MLLIYTVGQKAVWQGINLVISDTSVWILQSASQIKFLLIVNRLSLDPRQKILLSTSIVICMRRD